MVTLAFVMDIPPPAPPSLLQVDPPPSNNTWAPDFTVMATSASEVEPVDPST